MLTSAEPIDRRRLSAKAKAVRIPAAYFAGLCSELEDAVRIDGCSRLGAMLRVTLPLLHRYERRL